MKYMISVQGPDTSKNVVHTIYPGGKEISQDMMDPNIGGYRKCKHIYEYMYQDICPLCGRYTHESNAEEQTRLHKQWIADGKHLDNQCPQGGTIRGWWDI